MLELVFALLAGAFSTLSPCVLPVLPVVLGTAVGVHRLGPLLLAAGIALSFAAIGLFVAAAGFALRIDETVFRHAAGAVMIGVGVVLMAPPLQARLAAAAGPAGNIVHRRFGRFDASGPGGQFALGLLLGAVWSPCVGPTLGAASLLAARGENLGSVAGTMAVFGIGAALPLMALGVISREALTRWRGRFLSTGTGGKALLGIGLLGAGLLVVSGYDKILEAKLVEASPAWLTDVTTRF